VKKLLVRKVLQGQVLYIYHGDRGWSAVFEVAPATAASRTERDCFDSATRAIFGAGYSIIPTRRKPTRVINGTMTFFFEVAPANRINHHLPAK
jgi:hypothetical protein